MSVSQVVACCAGAYFAIIVGYLYLACKADFERHRRRLLQRFPSMKSNTKTVFFMTSALYGGRIELSQVVEREGQFFVLKDDTFAQFNELGHLVIQSNCNPALIHA
jgi:hypothetical protein